jgi:hypothetical protein
MMQPNRCWITKCRSTYVLLDDGGVDLEEVGPDVLRGDGVGVAHHEGGQDGHQSRIVLGQRHNHLNRRSTVEEGNTEHLSAFNIILKIL